jgi:hypothetical protein
VKQITITIFVVGFAAVFASVQASAEDFTAGKTPAQLFRSDCGECHRSPNGLVRDAADVRALASFLREHYTTKSETAGALAAYVSGFASSGLRSRVPAVPARDRSRFRSDAESEDAPVTQRSAEEPAAVPQPGQAPGRHRRATLSADGEKKADREKRRVRDDGDVPRPPRRIGTASAKPNAATRAGQPVEADDPISRLRTYFSSGVNSEGAIADADRTGAPKARKRRNAAGGGGANAEGTPVEPAAAPSAPAAMSQPAAPPAETAPDEPKQ